MGRLREDQILEEPLGTTFEIKISYVPVSKLEVAMHCLL
jgi:hypothetical protein